MADQQILPRLEGDPQPMPRAQVLHDFVYNTLVPEWLKDRPPSPMPLPGTPPGKIGPPSGPPTPVDLAGGALGEAINWLGGGGVGKAAGLAAKAAANKAVFAGPMAKMFNPKDFGVAEALKRAGAHPEFIYDNTGLFQDVEGNWMHKISDKGMTAKNLGSVYPDQYVRGVLANFIDHPELFRNYPKAQMLRMEVNPTYGTSGNAVYIDKNSGGPSITLGGGLTSSGLTPEHQMTLAHELQHYISDEEGFPQGGSDNWAGNAVRSRLNELAKDPSIKSDPEAWGKVTNALSHLLGPNKYKPEYEMYFRLPGEVGARNNARHFLYDKFGQVERVTPEGHILNFNHLGNIDQTAGHFPSQRAKDAFKYPWLTEDVPRTGAPLQQYDYIGKAGGR
jgi:hypothetical protein